MKISYIVTSLENGGAQLTIPPVLECLRRHGCDVRVIACEPRDMKAAEKLETAGIPYTVLFNSKRNKLTYVAGLVKALRAERPDIIWTSLSVATLVGQLAGKILGIPVVSWKNNAEARLYTQLCRNLTQLWVADSAMVATFLRQTMHIPAQRVMTWPLYCSDTSSFITAYWDGSRPLRLGSMGRLREQKNYGVLIDAMHAFLQKNPECATRVTLSIAGEGPLKEDLQSRINQYGLQNVVLLLGYNEDPKSYLKSLDVYVQPSLFEGMCLAAHEAMAMGLPVIATPVGELAFSVQADQTGFVLHGNIEQAFITTLENIFSTPQLVARYGTAAQKFVSDKFSEQAFDQAGTDILNQIKNMQS